jgi:hypothetical protein
MGNFSTKNEDKKMAVKRIEEIQETLKKQLVGLFAVGWCNGESYEDFYQSTVGFASTRSEAKLLVNNMMERNPAKFLRGWDESPTGISVAFTDVGESYSVWLITDENFDVDVLLNEPNRWFSNIE